jgi:predicted nuclease of predicted toxin-antitoxin system
MRIRADEHVSPKIVRAVRELAAGAGVELSSVIESGQAGASDVHWITRFARDGGHVVLTADTDFLKVPAQVLAVLQTGIRVVHLPNRWANAALNMQGAHLLLWWRRIEITVAAMSPRECRQPVWTLAEPGELRRVTLDFAGAERKARKDSRRR